MKTISYHHTPAERPLIAKTLVERLRENAEKHPEKTALVFRDTDGSRKSITYSEWRNSMERLGTAFIKMGMNCGDRVGVFLPTCPEFPLVQYGLHQAGVIPVFLAVTSKSDEDFFELIERFSLTALFLYAGDSASSREILSSALKYITDERASSRGIVHFPIITVSQDAIPQTQDYATILSQYDVDSEILRQREREFDFESTAAVFLTSGSTGLPKGIEHSHIYYASITEFILGDTDGVYLNDRPLVNMGGNWCLVATATTGSTTGTV